MRPWAPWTLAQKAGHADSHRAQTHRRIWLWLSKPFWDIPFWLAGECTTHFRVPILVVDWDVHWGYGISFPPEITTVEICRQHIVRAMIIAYCGPCLFAMHTCDLCRSFTTSMCPNWVFVFSNGLPASAKNHFVETASPV